MSCDLHKCSEPAQRGHKMILELDPGFWERAKKWFYGAGIAAAGALLTYASEWVTGADFGSWTPIVVAGFSAIVQTVRKFFPEIVVGTKMVLRLE